MKAEITSNPTPSATTMSDMRVGQLAQVCDAQDAEYDGMIVLRAYNGVISLTNPGRTWSTWGGSPISSLKVSILPVGTQVTLTQEHVADEQ